jgi:hypothetical protein
MQVMMSFPDFTSDSAMVRTSQDMKPKRIRLIPPLIPSEGFYPTARYVKQPLKGRLIGHASFASSFREEQRMG